MNDTELDQILDQWTAPEPSPALRDNLRAAFPQRPRRRVFGVPVRWMVTFAAAAGVLAIGTSFNGSLGESEGCPDLPTGRVCVHAKYFVDPPAAILRWWWKGHGSSVGSTPDGAISGSVHVNDQSAHLFYGFEYRAEAVSGGQYKVTFAPLRMSTLQRGPFIVTGQPAPLPVMPAPQIVADGQPIDVDVYRAGGERVYVRLQISASEAARETKPEVQPPTFLHTSNTKVYKNGAQVASFEGDAMGASIWFRLAGEGRYLITLDPTGNPAFAAAGQVNGNALEFQSGNDTYRLESAQPLATGAQRTIYVFHDLAFESQMKPGNSAPMVGAAGPACFFNGTCSPH